jgi:HSP20 family protein
LRQLHLGDGLDVDRIQASYDAGVLTVTIPVAERARPRRITVEAGGGRTSVDANRTVQGEVTSGS